MRTDATQVYKKKKGATKNAAPIYLSKITLLGYLLHQREEAPQDR